MKKIITTSALLLLFLAGSKNAKAQWCDCDGDGYGNPYLNSGTPTYWPNCPGGFSCGASIFGNDCNDDNPNIYPGAPEDMCNYVDDNCDGTTEGGPGYVYRDLDGDEYVTYLAWINNDSIAWCPNEPVPSGYALLYLSYLFGWDCDDNNPNIHPLAPEICDNGIDEDCDGNTDRIIYLDNDGDGYGTPCVWQSQCVYAPIAPPGWSLNKADCEDNNHEVHPGRLEECNSIDDNCNGHIDENMGINSIAYFPDEDHDGYGAPGTGSFFCPGSSPIGYVINNLDCNDEDAAIHPMAVEDCNDKDDNCNGITDDGITKVHRWRDEDGDGFGDISNSSFFCPGQAIPGGYVNNYIDCDPTNPAINPGGVEICNSIDDDCNGQVDEGLPLQNYYYDNDQDGYGDPSLILNLCAAASYLVSNNSDCNDGLPYVHVNAPEICNDIDDNCNGQVDEGLPLNTFYFDYDGDGYGSNAEPDENTCHTEPSYSEPPYSTNNLDCNDENAAIHPGATETTTPDDDNCNGQINEGLTSFPYFVDADGDGYGSPLAGCTLPSPTCVANSSDCDDSDPTRNPGVPELCNYIDDNCNTQVDEGLSYFIYYGDDDNDGFGNQASFHSCDVITINYPTNNFDCNDHDALIYPGSMERCNLIDDNCNGQIDDGLPLETRYYDGDDDGFGSESIGNRCDWTGEPNWALTSGDVFDDDDEAYPGHPEICNGKDDDGNGLIDDGLTFFTYYEDYDGDVFGGSWKKSFCDAVPPQGWSILTGDCDDDNSLVNYAANESCNDIDDNCNGQIDEGLSQIYFMDEDGDGFGYGSPADGFLFCEVQGHRSTNNLDCNDQDPLINPTTTEICNCIDDNCNGQIDEGLPITCHQQIPPILTNYFATMNGPDPAAYKIAVDYTGNAYVIGNFILTATFNALSLTSAGANDVFISKYDPDGQLLWVTSAGGSGNDSAKNIAVDSTGLNVYVTGVCASGAISFFSPSASVINRTATGSSDFFVARLNAATGNFMAAQMSGATSTGINSGKISAGIAISVHDSTIYVCGGIKACGNGSYGSSIPDHSACGSPLVPFLSKYDHNCNLQAVIAPPGSGTPCSDALMTGVYVQPASATSNPNEIFVSGFTNGQSDFGGTMVGEPGKTDPYYASYSSSFSTGNTTPTRAHWIQGGGTSSGITVTDDGFVYLLHSIVNDTLHSCLTFLGDSLEDAYLTKFDSSGCVWNSKISTSGNDKFESIAKGKNGELYVAGHTNGSPSLGSSGFTNQGSYDGLLAKYNGDGNNLWIKSIGGAGDDYTYGVATNVNGGVYITGSFHNSTLNIDNITVSAINETHGYIINMGELPPLAAASVTDTILCQAEGVDVNFKSASRNSGNIYTAQLSDNAGNFYSPLEIGTLSSTASFGTIHAAIPETTPAGNGYRIRVVASSPVSIGHDNGHDITVTAGITYYRDADNDGYGNVFMDSISCVQQPVGYVLDNLDCNDANNLIYPGSIELCNRLDDDCDGMSDEDFDTDADGVCDSIDNCPFSYNPGQDDFDADSIGDACDCADSDHDGICDSQENCAWQTVGNPWHIMNIQFNNSSYPEYTNFTFSPDGTPYVVFADQGNLYRLRVMRLVSGTWEDVGLPGFSGGLGTLPGMAIAVSPTGTPYIAYSNFGNGNSTYHHLTLMKFDGGTWVNEDSLPYTENGVADIHLDFNANGDLIMTYQNINGITTSKHSGSTWTTVGNSGITGGQFLDMTVGGDNAIYIAFSDVYNNYKASVMKYTLGGWHYVGSQGISDSIAEYTTIAVDDAGIPYISYCDIANGHKVTVKKFDAGNWTNVGSPGFSDNYAIQSDIKVDTAGVPFVSYVESGRSTVKKFNGNSWENVCSPHFGYGVPYYTSLQLDHTGTPYVMTNFRHFTTNNYPALWSTLPCIQPLINTVSASNDTVCSGDFVLLSIDTGSLNGATQWNWYQGSCGGVYVGSGPFIYAYPTITTTYYVKGEGGCVATSNCSSITVHVNIPSYWYQDVDSDGYGNNAVNYYSCDQPFGFVADNTDCDDYNSNVHIGCLMITYYADFDFDGYGDINISFVTGNSVPPYGFVLDSTDCAPDDFSVHPNAFEICNDIDDDCDGLTDILDPDFIAPSWYADADGDGYGDSSIVSHVCPIPLGYVSNHFDCDDTQLLYYDYDGDGYGYDYNYYAACGVTDHSDCNDYYFNVHPGAPEICDYLDNDCNGLIDANDSNYVGDPMWYADADGDGYGNPLHDTITCPQPFGFVVNHDDCDDANAEIHPYATEICNGVDDDCDSLTDETDFYSILIIEGYYMGNGLMNSPLYNSSLVNDPIYCDTVSIQLYDPLTLTAEYSTGVLLGTNGLVIATIPCAFISNSYYLVIKSRNSIETWSKEILTIGNTTVYNFAY